MNSNPPSRTRFPFRRPPLRRAAARRSRPGGDRPPFVPDRITSCTLFATGGPFNGVQATNVAFADGESGFVRLTAAGTTGKLLTRLAYNLKWKASALDGDGFSDL